MNQLLAIDPDRLNLPSASSAEADSLCPGRHLAQIQFPEQTNPDSEFGSRVHLAFRGERVDLTDTEKEVFIAARSIEERELQAWDIEGSSRLHREERLFLHDDKTLAPIASGQADAYWISWDGKRALLEDLKSLWGDHTEAELNMQLRDLAVLIWVNHGTVQEVYAFINQPTKTHTPVKVCYQEADLIQAAIDMRARIKSSMDPSSRRIPGAVQCRYCRARAHCPEAHGAMIELAEAKIEALTPNQVNAILPKIEIVEDVIAGIKRHAYQLLESDPASLPDYHLKPGAVRRSIEDIRKAYEVLVQSKVIDAIHFLGACKLNIGELGRAITAFTGEPKTQAEARVNLLLGSIIETKQNKPSLERKKGCE